MQNAVGILSDSFFSILDAKLVKTNLGVFVRIDPYNDYAVLLFHLFAYSYFICVTLLDH